MKVLVACEFSATVREAFRRRGHDAWSCDILPSEIPGPHSQMDIFEFLAIDPNWDLMIFHWPCRLQALSGVRWLSKRVNGVKRIDPDRYTAMKESAEKFDRLFRWKSIPKICGENPVPHSYARVIMGDYSQVIQPWQFGHAEKKKTCLWLKNLPPLRPTKIVRWKLNRRPVHLANRIHHMAPGPERAKERSRTFLGIAEAMAEQWGNL